MEYNHREIEKKWQKEWAEKKTFKAENNSPKPKYYVLDMFPYPSGAGLHVGHPLGYIASDIIARYKRARGFNVLHPMGYDSFGLPAEQYAIQTGQHPALTTEENIKRYREQLDKIGFSFDWDREVRTSDPNYYKWTQWIFIELFNSWYNPRTNKAEKIESLISIFETEGFKGTEHDILTGEIEKDLHAFTSEEWKKFDEKKKSDVMMNFRIAYLGEAYVNWCPAMGTVLANDEVKDGVSERGGHPVERKLMKQWSMRITAYAQRLLESLDALDWSESMKEAQRNWIGKSEGSSIQFQLEGHAEKVEVFTTRPDTIFGVSFLTLAPEHELVQKITTPDRKEIVDAYVTFAKNRSERERMADVKKITGEFTGAYAVHPFSGKKIPVWIGDYVLAGYGTGAVMAVPGHDTRDYAFAKHFDLPIIEVVAGGDLSKEAYDAKEGKLVDSDFLNGLDVKDAIKKAIKEIESKHLGKGKTNFRLRDAVFGRQRYWGEPIPIYYKDGIPHAVDFNDLPVTLPEVDKYLPTAEGEPPLARAKDWKYKGEFEYEQTTMPGWAGSSWYFLRYMDAKNEKEFVSKNAAEYWENVDLYVGGAEHATGHLLYVRFWTKFLKDMQYIKVDEPAKKLINQGMIQGVSSYVHFVAPLVVGASGTSRKELKKPNFILISYDLVKDYESGKTTDFLNNEYNKILKKYNPDFEENDKRFNLSFSKVAARIEDVSANILDTNKFVDWKRADGMKSEFEFILNPEGNFIISPEVEKMSKSKWNVVNPDELCDRYGADAFRLYEMFLGPLTDSKPWDTQGIEGVYRFLRKLWRLFYSDNGKIFTSDAPTKADLKALHKCIKKATEDIDRYSFNTVVSTFMICVNELTELKCNKQSVLQELVILLAPYAPHIAEELWANLGNTGSVVYAPWPKLNEEYLVEGSFAYPVSFNGKTRFNIELSTSLNAADVEKEVMASDLTLKYLEGKTPKKVIVVPKRIVNIVV